jgi:putative ABC transport system permease protein
MVRTWANLKIALNNLRATRVRTALTVLGIVIGVTSVTAVLALSEGAKNAVRDQAKELGDDLITVRPGKATRDTAGNVVAYDYLAAFGSSTITERDLSAIKATEGVKIAAPLMLVTGSLRSAEKTAANSAIIGTTEQGDEALGLTLRAGQFLDEKTNADTVVLGSSLAVELLGSDTLIGQQITIRGEPFTVIGILDHFGSSATVSTVFDLNRTAFVQLHAAKAFNQGISNLQQIVVRSAPEFAPADVAKNLEQKVVASHDFEEDISVLLPNETVQISDGLFQMLSSAISAVAAISILVGGVGVMNIMLVSVTERTREIGIRKAVGATNQQILSQFLIEALVMTVAGGILGIIVGYAIAYVLGLIFGFLPGISWIVFAAALGVSIVVGLLFGAWPAIKAARKDPIEALRYFQ